MVTSMSGYQDSNPGPSRPKSRDALPDCATSRKLEATNKKSEPLLTRSMSGYQDSNLGPPAPKAGALPGCATSRNL